MPARGFGRGILETFVREGATVLGPWSAGEDSLIDSFNEQQAY